MFGLESFVLVREGLRVPGVCGGKTKKETARYFARDNLYPSTHTMPPRSVCRGLSMPYVFHNLGIYHTACQALTPARGTPICQ